MPKAKRVKKRKEKKAENMDKQHLRIVFYLIFHNSKLKKNELELRIMRIEIRFLGIEISTLL